MTRSNRIHGARLWLTSGVLLVAVAVGMRTLEAVVAAGSWASTALWVTAPVALVIVVLRQVVRSRLAPTAWGLLAAVTAVAAWYGDAVPGPSVPKPTGETVERIRLLVDSGVQAITDGRVPVQPTRGLELLIVAGTVATYVLAELLAIGLGRGALGGLLLAGLWAPAVSFERDPGLVLKVAGGTTFLLLLVLTRARSRRNDRAAAQEAPWAAATAAAISVVALLLGTAAAALPFYGSTTLPSGWGGAGLDSPLRVSTDLDMRADLEGRSGRPLLRYSGDGSAIDALRMYTMSTFDGQEWQRSPGGDAVRDATGLIWPGPEVAAADDEPARVQVEVFALNQDRLPIPTEPSFVDVDGSWDYDAGRDEVVANGRTTRGLTYGLTIMPRDLSAAGLRADTAGVPPDVGEYLQVPSTLHEADIRALAEDVTTGSTTTYDQAIALQSYLRSSVNFEYSTELGPVRTPDAVWDFLTDRRGYCVQYATTMTVMARMLGIPARMAVGFLPGLADDDVVGQYVVSGRQAHTWPELYFADAGWVRFEPTPAGQTGAPPLYADPLAGQAQIPDDQIPTSAAGPVGPVTPGAVAGGDRSGFVTLGTTDIPTVAVVGTIGVVVIGIAGVLVLTLRRRRAQARVPRDPEEWWARLRERLAAHGVVWTDATTPRQAADVVRDRLPGPADADAQELMAAHGALDELVDALETQRYTTRPVVASGEEMGAWIDAVERPLGAPVVARP